MQTLSYFGLAASEDPGAGPAIVEHAGGISALGLNLQAFLFQLITFVIVLLLLRKFVYKRLVATLEARQTAVEESLENADKTAQKMADAQKDIAKLLAETRVQADEIIVASRKEATQLIADAEQKASRKAEHIVAEAKSQMDVELQKARKALEQETAHLVAMATEAVINERLDPAKDERLISTAINGAKERLHG